MLKKKKTKIISASVERNDKAAKKKFKGKGTIIEFSVICSVRAI